MTCGKLPGVLQHEPAHVLAAQNKRAIEDLLCDLAEQANAKDARGLAQELCLVMEGAYVTRHVTGDKHTIDIARRIAKRMIAASCPEASRNESDALACRQIN